MCVVHNIKTEVGPFLYLAIFGSSCEKTTGEFRLVVLTHIAQWQTYEENVQYVIITDSMEQSSSWEANRFSSSQDVSSVLWNLNVH
jgi:hypothetical protein